MTKGVKERETERGAQQKEFERMANDLPESTHTQTLAHTLQRTAHMAQKCCLLCGVSKNFVNFCETGNRTRQRGKAKSVEFTWHTLC